MKKVTQSVTYQCDSCKGPETTAASLPNGWKELQVSIRSSGNHPQVFKTVQVCSTCCQPGNASAATLLATFLH